MVQTLNMGDLPDTLKESLPEYMLDILAPYQSVLETLHRQLREATAREERKAARALPVGLGALPPLAIWDVVLRLFPRLRRLLLGRTVKRRVV